MTERRKDGIAESRNGEKSLQMLKDGIAESRNGGKYPQILKKSPQNPNRRNQGKSSEILKDGIAENQPKSEKTESRSWHLHGFYGSRLHDLYGSW